MAKRRAPDQTDDGLEHLAAALLAARQFGLLWTRAISHRVGDDYTDNAAIASLSAIRAHGPLRLRDLTTRVGLPSPTLSRVVDRLVANGDVTREAGPTDGDGRAVLMTITAVGVAREHDIDRAIYDDCPAAGPLVKEAVVHLDLLVERPPVTADRSPVEHLDDSLAGVFARLGITVGDALRSISASGDITEALTLLAFVEETHPRPSKIASRVGLSSGGTTKVLDRLESAGQIERTFGTSDDRRGVDLHLTAEGRHQLRAMGDKAEPHLAALLASFHAVLDRVERID
jgi:DNA-binding MarR family transcriptional regulator